MIKAEARRAERVRSRRVDQTKQRLSESAMLATRPVAPITTRRVPAAAIGQSTAGSRVRRRARRPLQMPGMEVRLPSIQFSSAQVKWRTLSLLLSLVLAAGIYLAWSLPEFRVATADVSGNRTISADEIRAVVDSQDQLVFSLVPADLELRLRRNFPELLLVNVSVSLPNSVSVIVKERTPVILWQQGDAYTWIDDKGVAFRPRKAVENLIAVKANAAPEPGLASGGDPLTPAPFISTDVVNSIKMLAQQMPANSSMLYDNRYGLGWLDARGWEVYFGAGAREMPARLAVYQALVGLFDKEGIVPAFVDVEFPTVPYYRMNQ